MAPSTTIRAFGFDDDDLLEAFVRVEDRIYRDDPIGSRLPRPDVRAQLSPRNPFFMEGGEHRSFVAFAGEEPTPEPIGRVVAMRSPRLGSDGGVVRTLGPMNFSTWYRYRFVTAGHERGPFLLEPYNPAYYGRLFEAAGFRVHNAYATLRLTHTPVPLLEAMHGRCVRHGVVFEPLDLARADDALPMFYELSKKIFAGKTAYSAISYEEFLGLYRNASSILEPGLSWIARDAGGEALGFLFAYPDLLEPMRRGDPSSRPETTVLKTIGIVPDAPKGLGWALCHLHIVASRERGYRHGLYALMEKWQELLRYAQADARKDQGGGGEVWKEYTLFERT